ncbi:MAG: organomercurial lyase, partial [Stellaceae bacterium]
ETRQAIHLTVSPVRIETVEPAGTVVSAVRAGGWDLSTVERLMASSCHHIFFFASRQSGERWQAKHPETLLLSLDEAFALGKRSNAHLFGAALAEYR